MIIADDLGVPVIHKPLPNLHFALRCLSYLRSGWT